MDEGSNADTPFMVAVINKEKGMTHDPNSPQT
jgi:hypothetical protein